MQALIINLEKDIDRYYKLEKKCKNLDYVPHRIDAVYGKELSNQEFKDKTTEFCNNFCTPGMVGCWLSHLKCYQYIVDNNLDRALILEDDAVFVEDYQEKMREIEPTFPDDYDMIFLGNLTSTDEERDDAIQTLVSFMFKNILTLPGKYEKINNNLYRTNRLTGTQGYIVSNKGAKRCLKILNLVNGHLDLNISKKLDSIEVYVVYPSLINQNNNYESSISTDFPIAANNILNKINLYNLRLGWLLSVPLISINSYIVCAWSFIFLILGLIAGYSVKNFIIVLFLMLLILSGERKFTIQLLGSLLIFLFGIMCGCLFFRKRKD